VKTSDPTGQAPPRGFAGAKCQIYLSDGRTIFVKETRGQICERLPASRWVVLTDLAGVSRWISSAQVVELASLGPED
jgi:hypothetical protein